MLDLETANGLDPVSLSAWAQTWLSQVTAATGVRPIIYTNPKFWSTSMAEHRLVREERLLGPLDRALDEGESARRSGRQLGRQRLDVLAVLECGHRARDQRARGSRSLQRVVAAGVVVRALTARPRRARLSGRALLLAGVAAAFIVVGVILAGNVFSKLTMPGGGPLVLAGRQLWGSCAAGFYARLKSSIVLTSSAHCAAEGMTALDPVGRTVRGVFGPAAVLESCPHEGHTCRPSDMNYLVVARDQIPWGHLNVVDMGEGGKRVIESDTAPLSCPDIEIGDDVEINGRDIHRVGTVAEIGEYLHDPAADGDYFPCIVAAADIQVGVGDSGGAVLVRGLPAGATSRSFGGMLGFTPLAEGLDALGLELCTTPDCGLTPQ